MLSLFISSSTRLATSAAFDSTPAKQGLTESSDLSWMCRSFAQEIVREGIHGRFKKSEAILSPRMPCAIAASLSAAGADQFQSDFDYAAWRLRVGAARIGFGLFSAAQRQRPSGLLRRWRCASILEQLDKCCCCLW